MHFEICAFEDIKNKFNKGNFKFLSKNLHMKTHRFVPLNSIIKKRVKELDEEKFNNNVLETNAAILFKQKMT